LTSVLFARVAAALDPRLKSSGGPLEAHGIPIKGPGQ
jgi:hypothetical protein